MRKPPDPDHRTARRRQDADRAVQRLRVSAWISERFSSGFESAPAPDLRPAAPDGRQQTFELLAPTAALRPSELTGTASADAAGAAHERQVDLIPPTNSAPTVAPAR